MRTMKVKLITIAVLALLLCAAVPMTATAVKPETSPKPITTPIYLIQPGVKGLGPIVGHAVILNNGKYTLTLTNLDSYVGSTWIIGTAITFNGYYYPQSPTIYQVYIGDSTPIIERGAIPQGDVSTIRTTLSNGGAIVMCQPS